MQDGRSGFTLIETLISMVVLVAGIVVVAQLFSYSIGVNISTGQMTTATVLTSNQMEALRVTPFEKLLVGGSLDPGNRATGFWHYVSVAKDGTITADTVTPTATYLRLWNVSGTNPKTIAVVVFSQRSGVGRQRTELMRASTAVTKRF